MNFYETLKTQLQKIPELINEEGNIKKWVVVHKAQNFDEKLISLLLDNQILKKEFFINIKEILVFNQYHFIQFLEYKNYFNDSYTQYKNKVGLTIAGKHLKQRNEVALVWPYKDCVLEGGQSREKDKKEEIFFNETLAQDEITQLLAPKVLTNAKVFDKDGEHGFSSFHRDAEINRKRGLPENTITDNLIVKGNNLLALHSIKKEFVGKVKLIYIDPPYNTGNDGFKYNDNFNHSTWLTFMKNRLEVARELLNNNGSIWINIDDREGHYLKILCDEIMGRDNFIINFIWQKKYSPSNDAKFFSDNHDHILVFAKDRSRFKANLLPRSEEMNKRYTNPDNDYRGSWKPGGFSVKTYTKDYDYPIETPSGRVVNPPSGSCWQTSKDNFLKKIKDNRIWFGVNGDSKPQLKQFFSEVQQGVVSKSIWLHSEVGHNQISRSEIIGYFGEYKFSTPKPESLLKRIIELSTKENDIVLDFFAGSATTLAVAMKLKRRFIGIEQMDYIKTVSVERIKKVIEGVNVGISKSVNWQGGGSFTYFELKKHNQNFMEQIEIAKDTKTLLKVWEEMKKESFLNYNVDIQKQENNMKGFRELSFKKQKQHLCELLDKNQMYINLSSLKDEDLGCTNEEKQVTEDFYQ